MRSPHTDSKSSPAVSAAAPRVALGAWAVLLACLCAAAPLRGQVRIVTAGDSITAGVGASSAAAAYPARLAALLGPGFVVQPEATSGATLLRAGRPSYRQTPGVANAVSAAPDIITVMLGTNDSKASNWTGDAVFVDDYVALLDTFRSRLGAVDLYPMLPPPANEAEIRGSLVADEIIPAILDAARRRDLTVIDAHTPLAGSVQTLLTDGVHPTDAGHQLIAEQVRAALVDERVLRPLPAPWQRLDVGATGYSGADALEQTGSVRVLGGGASIGGRADAFRFVYQTTAGDAEIAARVGAPRSLDPLAETAGGASAGVMLRETPARDARHVAVVVTARGGVSFRWRTSRGGPTGSADVVGITPPVWLRVSRGGNDFFGSYSADGVNWTQIGTARRIAMGVGAHAGLAVNSARPRQIAVANFEQVRIVRQPADAPLVSETLTANAGPGVVALAWTPSLGATSYRVLRAATPDGAFSERGVATGPAFTDGSVAAGSTHYYTVVATNGAVAGAGSMLARVGPPAAPTGLEVAMPAPAQALLEWNPRDEATSYLVKRSTDGGPFADIATVSGQNGYTDTGLSLGSSYRYVVSALNASGESAGSGIAVLAPFGSEERPAGPRRASGRAVWPLRSGGGVFMDRSGTESVRLGERAR
jgi:lysophospholipase L1-like esterase